MSNLTRARRAHPEIAPNVPICSRCEGINDRDPKRYRYCRACHAAYMRGWRARVDVSCEANVSRDEEFEHLACACAALEGRVV